MSFLKGDLPSPEDYIEEDTRDGKEGLKIHGAPKQGKSNTLNRIDKDDMLRFGKNLIMPGDVNCEFRNLLYHHQEPVKSFDILVPHDCEFKFANIPEWALKHLVKVNYDNDIIVEDFLKNKDRHLLIVFDDHLDDLIFHQRLNIWNDIGKQLIRRTFELDRPIIFRFDEGGVYFPEIAIGDHYKGVYRFNSLNVSYRKSKVELQLISQLDSEMKQSIHGKQNWVIYKKGVYSKRVPMKIRRAAPFFSRDQMALSYGGIYNKEVYIYKMKEAPVVWKMIPITDYQDRDIKTVDEQEAKKVVYAYMKSILPDFIKEYKNIKGFTMTRLSKITGIPKTTIYDWLNTMEQSPEFGKFLSSSDSV